MRGSCTTHDDAVRLVDVLARYCLPPAGAAEQPTWSPPTKIAAKYLAPYLEMLDR